MFTLRDSGLEGFIFFPFFRPLEVSREIGITGNRADCFHSTFFSDLFSHRMPSFHSIPRHLFLHLIHLQMSPFLMASLLFQECWKLYPLRAYPYTFLLNEVTKDPLE